MGTIPQELVTFKTTVESNLDSMNSICTSIIEKVAETINANESATMPLLCNERKLAK